MAGFRYQRLTQGSDEIRLLRIHPLGYTPMGYVPQEPVVCDVFVAKLSENPEYEALSYTWGSLEPREITVNGVSFNITQNLLLALQQLRATMSQVFWVDQICIDQSNLEERAQQIQFMAQIYSRAKSVHISIDPKERHYDLAAYHCINQFRSNRVNNADPMYNIPISEWKSTFEMMLSPWFQRSWILQEAIMARESHVLYGGSSVLWNGFSFAIEKLQELVIEREELRDWYRALDFSKLIAFARACNVVSSIEHFQHLQVSESQKPLIFLLRSFRNSSATDLRDKIYSVLGMAADASLYPVPNYQCKVEELYQTIAETCLTKQPHHLISVLAEAGLHKHKLDLPSWIPDWSCQVPDTYLNLSQKLSLNQISGELDVDDDGLSCKPLFEVKIEKHNDAPALMLTGKLLDVITGVGPSLNVKDIDTLSEAHFILWLFQSIRFAKPVFGIDGNRFIRVTTIGLCDETETAQGARVQQSVTRRRAVCITAQERLGLVPWLAQEGDFVAVLDGLRCPVVLRDGGNETFLFVGDMFYEDPESGLELNTNSQTELSQIILR